MNSNVTISGNLTIDPELKELADGLVVTNFSLAQTDRKQDRNTGEWQDVHTSYYKVNCWRSLGRRVASDLRKGDPVIVIGKQKVNRWQRRDGCWTSDTEIDAQVVGIDLRRISVQVRRRDRVPVQVATAPVATSDTIDPFARELAPATESAA